MEQRCIRISSILDYLVNVLISMIRLGSPTGKYGGPGAGRKPVTRYLLMSLLSPFDAFYTQDDPVTGAGEGSVPFIKTSSVERLNLESGSWDDMPGFYLSIARAGHTVSSIPEAAEASQKEMDLEDPSLKYKNPIADGMDKNRAIISFVLIYIPTLYVCFTNLLKSLSARAEHKSEEADENESSGEASVIFRSFATLVIPFPFMQAMVRFAVFKIINPERLKLINPGVKTVHIQKMDAELALAGTFYNSCPSIILQILIVLFFPDRGVTWLQILTISTSLVMTLWTAANLITLQLEKQEAPKKKSSKDKCKIMLKSLRKLMNVPLVLSSIVFNFITILLTILNVSYSAFFYLYFFAAFISIFWPATFSPHETIEKLERKLGYIDEETEREPSLQFFTNTDPNKELGRSLGRAVNMACVNMFCIARPIYNNTPELRRYMIGLYPFHFIVNQASLVFLMYFGYIDTLHFNNVKVDVNMVIWIGIGSGCLNLILLVLFYYTNLFCMQSPKKREINEPAPKPQFVHRTQPPLTHKQSPSLQVSSWLEDITEKQNKLQASKLGQPRGANSRPQNQPSQAAHVHEQSQSSLTNQPYDPSKQYEKKQPLCKTSQMTTPYEQTKPQRKPSYISQLYGQDQPQGVHSHDIQPYGQTMSPCEIYQKPSDKHKHQQVLHSIDLDWQSHRGHYQNQNRSGHLVQKRHEEHHQDLQQDHQGAEHRAPHHHHHERGQQPAHTRIHHSYPDAGFY